MEEEQMVLIQYLAQSHQLVAVAVVVEILLTTLVILAVLEEVLGVVLVHLEYLDKAMLAVVVLT
jgi:hypothetical protein